MLRKSVSTRKLIPVTWGLVALAAMTIAMMPRVAQAEEAPFNGAFTVQAELITTLGACDPLDRNCMDCVSPSSFYVEAKGIGDTSLGRLFLVVLKCFNLADGTYKGTFTMTAANGKDSVTGNYSGRNDTLPDFYGFVPFSGDLTITGATGKFDGALGTASFTAQAGPLTPGPSPNTLVLMAFYEVHGKLELRDDVR
jgi:hypothetical protein